MKSSIVNIKSLENNSFGTGFVIHQDEKGVYVLTCKHVVEDVVKPIVENMPAEVVAQGEFIDMAVLYVRNIELKSFELQFDDCDSRTNNRHIRYLSC